MGRYEVCHHVHNIVLCASCSSTLKRLRPVCFKLEKHRQISTSPQEQSWNSGVFPGRNPNIQEHMDYPTGEIRMFLNVRISPRRKSWNSAFISGAYWFPLGEMCMFLNVRSSQHEKLWIYIRDIQMFLHFRISPQSARRPHEMQDSSWGKIRTFRAQLQGMFVVSVAGRRQAAWDGLGLSWRGFMEKMTILACFHSDICGTNREFICGLGF